MLKIQSLKQIQTGISKAKTLEELYKKIASIITLREVSDNYYYFALYELFKKARKIEPGITMTRIAMESEAYGKLIDKVQWTCLTRANSLQYIEKNSPEFYKEGILFLETRGEQGLPFSKLALIGSRICDKKRIREFINLILKKNIIWSYAQLNSLIDEFNGIKKQISFRYSLTKLNDFENLINSININSLTDFEKEEIFKKFERISEQIKNLEEGYV